MKVYKAQFDATIITLIAKSFDDAVMLLKENDSAFFTDANGTLKYKWSEKYSDFVYLDEQKMQRGIICRESH